VTKNIKNIIFLLLLITLSGCFSSSSSNKEEVKKTKVEININLLDASGGLVNEDVNLKFMGVDVYDSSNNKITSLNLSKSDDKNISISLDDKPKSKKDLRIIVSANNYSQTGSVILLNTTSIKYNKTIKMIKDKAGKIANGIYSAHLPINLSIDSNGTTTNSINLKAQEDENSTSVSINIPSGTQFTDENGNIVNASMLKMVSFDANESESLNAYPGGLNVIANVDGFENNSSNSTAQINFKSAAFAMITIEDENGNKVRHFDKNITITMQFPVGTKDASGNVVVVGDEVPIWAYNESSGMWSYDKVAIVSNDDNDNLLEASYQTDHLTYWNLDWHYGEVCTSHINIVDSNGDPITYNLTIQVNIPDASVNRQTPYNSGDGNMDYANTPSGYSATLNAYYMNSIVGTVNSDDLCANNTTLVIDNNVTVVDSNITFEYQCSNGTNIPDTNNTSVRFDTNVYTGFGPYIQTNNGMITLSGVENSSLNVSLYSYYNDFRWNNIDWNDPRNTSSFTLNVGQNLNKIFYLKDIYCSPYDNNITTIIDSYKPIDMEQDSSGNIYFSAYDNNGSKIYKIDSSTNQVSTFIGTSDTSYNGNGQNAVSINNINLSNPSGLDIKNGKLYIADSGHHCIREVDLTANTIKDIIGQCGVMGDSNATYNNISNAVLKYPIDIEKQNDTYVITDSGNNKVKIVSSIFDNKIITIAGGGTVDDVTFENNTSNDSNSTYNYPKNRDALEANISVGWLAIGRLSINSGEENYYDENMSDGSIYSYKSLSLDLYITSPYDNRVRKLYTSLNDNNDMFTKYNYLTTIVGLGSPIGYGTSSSNGDGNFSKSASINFPQDIEIDSNKDIYISDMLGNKIRKINAQPDYNVQIWTISTIAGDGTTNTINNVSSSLSGVEHPIGLFIQSNNDFYIAEHGNKIRKVSY